MLISDCPFCAGESAMHGINGHEASCCARNLPLPGHQADVDHEALDQLSHLLANDWTDPEPAPEAAPCDAPMPGRWSA